MDFFILYNKELISIVVISFVLILNIVLFFLDKKMASALSPIVLIFISVIFSLFTFNKISVVTSSFNDYFNEVYMSKNFIEDRGSLSQNLYRITGKGIVKNDNMSIIIVSPYQLEIDIDNINKDYLSNKEKSDPDLNICDSIANSAKKYDGIIENPLSCLSNGSMKIFFDMRNRSQQSQYQNGYTGQQPMMQQNGYNAQQQPQQQYQNGYTGQQPMMQQNGYNAQQQPQQQYQNGYAGQQPMMQQNGYNALQQPRPQYKNGYEGQQPMHQQNGYNVPQQTQQQYQNGYAGQWSMQQQNGYNSPQPQQQYSNGYAGQQPMPQQNGYHAPQMQSGSSVN